MKNTRVSVCIIAKNCADIIPVTLRWATETFEEVCVVCDPENDDDTGDLLYSWGDRIKLKYHPFDNFSEQKNRVFEMATRDWILSVDSDEIFELDIPWDLLVQKMEKDGVEVGGFQLYNIQKDLDHYRNPTEPKFRLMRREHAKMDGKPVDEGIHMGNKKFFLFPYAHIHFGHIRNETALLLKGKDRIKWKDIDPAGGPGLREHGERFFVERNKEWDKQIAEVPSFVRKAIKRYW